MGPVSENNDEGNNTIKENSSPNQNSEMDTTLVNDMASHRVAQKTGNVTTVERNEGHTTQNNGKIKVLDVRTLNKNYCTGNVLSDPSRANSIPTINSKKSYNTPQKLSRETVGPSPSGWTGKTTTSPKKSSSATDSSSAQTSKVHQNTISSRQPLEPSSQLRSTPSKVAKVPNVSAPTVPPDRRETDNSRTDQVVIEKTPRKTTPTKMVVDNQQPSCSKSSVKENLSSFDQSQNKSSTNDEGSSRPSKTPQKNTPTKMIVDNQQPSCSKSSVKENLSSVDQSQNKSSTNDEGNSRPSKTPRKTTPTKMIVDNQQPSCSKSSVKENLSSFDQSQNKSSTNDEGSSRPSKTPQKNTPTKMIVDNQQPSCSKSSVKEKLSSVDQSQNKSSTNDKNNSSRPSNGNCSTPEKQNTRPTATSSKGSPRKKLFSSPSKGSPTKTREIKSLKSKEGKRLQVRQMDELVKLFKSVKQSRHLRSLLNDEENYYLQKFINIEDNKKYVVMKLFVWKKLWYNIFDFCTKAQIEFDDDKDIIDIFEYLREERFVDTDYKTSASLPELLNKLDVTKLKEIMKEFKIKPMNNKTENVKKLLMVASNQSTLTCRKSFKDLILDSIEKKIGFAVKLKPKVYNSFYNAYLLATFTNPDFDDVQIYFNNIIHHRITFPETDIEDYPVFYSRDEFLSYGRAVKMRRELEEMLVNKNKEHRFMGIRNIGKEAYGYLYNTDTDDAENNHAEAPHLKRFTARHLYCGIVSTCCEHIFTKQNGYPNDVRKWLEYLIRKFPNSKRLGKWYHKLIWLHMRHLNVINYEMAAKLLIEALKTKNHVLGDIAKHELGALGKSLKTSKVHKIDQLFHDRVAEVVPRDICTAKFPQQQIDSQCIRTEKSGRKRVYIDKNNEETTMRGVEQVALEYYRENGYPGGEHCEGSLIKALLTLFFWDIIYKPSKNIPGIFISKLQSAPLDMFTPSFYKNRKDLIDERLREISFQWSEEEIMKFVVDNLQKHSHEKAAFGMVVKVIGDIMTVEVLITVIDRKVLSKIFERLIKNIREFSSGMPDLLMWNIDTKTCKFVEVKGEGDRLSTGQKLWLQYLQEIGAQTEVCWVHSTGSKRKKINKIPSEIDEQDDEAGS